MKRTIVTLSVLIFAILLACSVVEVVRNEQQYFPLAESNEWVYEVRCNGAVDTVTCRMKQIGEGEYAWDNQNTKADDSGYASIMGGTTFIGGSEPFDDSSKIVVDSAMNLSWRGVGDISGEKDYTNEGNIYTVSTPAGTFTDCIKLEDPQTLSSEQFEVWLAPDIGPVQIYRWFGSDIIIEYRLIEFIPSS
ncbi:hypothetical protein GF359_07635 [candidate division WOR-3 bacterium]|uniref:DUF3108 domain-containing protein n=1 Tax=candidate division WOR-3 bacterium TaxID=2052148 RepID=A0A9D5KA47_UNCW3|nr:hypothetical protein [candidate division WOR-3 bacterium]MBD3365072.1 hypothetical protein [candidate division WOR-3 bacterium]